MTKYMLAFDSTSIFLSLTPLYSDKYVYTAESAFDALQEHINKTGEKRQLLNIMKKIAPAKWQDISIHSNLKQQ